MFIDKVCEFKWTRVPSVALTNVVSGLMLAADEKSVTYS